MPPRPTFCNGTSSVVSGCAPGNACSTPHNRTTLISSGTRSPASVSAWITPPAGPEVEVQSSWDDDTISLRVFKTSSGECLVITENGGWGGK